MASQLLKTGFLAAVVPENLTLIACICLIVADLWLLVIASKAVFSQGRVSFNLHI